MVEGALETGVDRLDGAAQLPSDSARLPVLEESEQHYVAVDRGQSEDLLDHHASEGLTALDLLGRGDALGSSYRPFALRPVGVSSGSTPDEVAGNGGEPGTRVSFRRPAK